MKDIFLIVVLAILTYTANAQECGNKNDGTVIPHDHECTKYYVCVNQIKQEEVCPPDQHFSPTKLYCMTPDEAGCDDKGSGNQCSNKADGTMIPHEHECTKYYLCVNQLKQEKVCAHDQHFSPTKLYCMTPDEAGCDDKGNQCANKADGTMIPHEHECTKYYLCVNQLKQEKVCAHDQHFSPTKLYCMTPDEAGCDDKGNQCANKADGTMIPHGHKCTNYYLCVNQLKQEKVCAHDQHFSPTKLYCMTPDEAGCEENGSGNECANKADGTMIPHEHECTKYYLCVNQLKQEKVCAHDQHFSPTKLYCMTPDKAGCDDKGNQCANKSDGTMIPHEHECTNYYLCVNQLKQEKVCAHDQHFSPTKLYCMTPDEAGCDENGSGNQCANKADGTMIPHENECTNYYLCVNQLKQEKVCAHDQHFSPTKLYCMAPDKAGCDDKGNQCANKSDGTMIPHEHECTKYYLCVNQLKQEKVCAHDQHFSPTKLYCMTPDEAGCDENGSGNQCANKADGTMISHENECTNYYLCVNQLKQEKVCAHDQHFSPTKLYCMTPDEAGCAADKRCTNKVDGTQFPHENDCSKYYVCQNYKIKLRSCTAGLHYSPTNKLCMTPDDAGCAGDKECANRPIYGAQFPHENDCNKYYVCIYYKKKLKSCDAGLHYSPTKQYCMTPDEAGCADNICGNRIDGTMIPHENECTKYYLCVDHMKQEKVCAFNQHFSPTKLYCLPQYKVKCN